MSRLGKAAKARKDIRAAGLHYVSDRDIGGITRHGSAGKFRYRSPAGKSLKDKSALGRIRRLAIPPAWTDVWIAPSANAHLQATGRDAKGRKQYLYHPDFAALRDAAKFAHLARFAASLPAIRRRLRRDLKHPGLRREKVLAAVVTLLAQTLIRVGNEDYARANHSYGLTTLRNRHVKVHGARIQFLFQGKSGKDWNLSLADARMARIVRSCQELPGQHLFEYRDGTGGIRAVTSAEVNRYLRRISGRAITAKDFRTWAGTVQAAMMFHDHAGRAGKSAARAIIARVARHLGNTVAVCRKCYIYPGLVEDFESGRLRLAFPRRGRAGLSIAESAVAAYLRKHATGKPAS